MTTSSRAYAASLIGEDSNMTTADAPHNWDDSYAGASPPWDTLLRFAGGKAASRRAQFVAPGSSSS